MREILRILPGYNCGRCGHRQCKDFARTLAQEDDPGQCPFLREEPCRDNSRRIVEALPSSQVEIRGVLVGDGADFILSPLEDEDSCREDLYPFDPELRASEGDLLRYRPLGCPITHFARVLEDSHGVLTVHMTGPIHLLGEDVEYVDAGICMVAAFEGTVTRGSIPDVGETVRFLPDHCMMQKVHSGVIVHSEDKNVRIEGIDLKVW